MLESQRTEQSDTALALPRHPRAISLTRRVVLATVLLTSVMAGPVAAQVRVAGLGFYQKEVLDGTFGVGGRIELDLGFLRRGIAVAGAWDHYFPECDDCSLREVGGQFIVGPDNPLYLGLGAGLQRFDRPDDMPDTDDWVFNFALGIRYPVLPVLIPFLEVRQEFGSTSANRQTFSLGVLFGPASARNAPARPRTR